MRGRERERDKQTEISPTFVNRKEKSSVHKDKTDTTGKTEREGERD